MLTCEISPELVDEAIEACGCREKRRRLLPARTVAYFVLGMCLLAGEDSARPPGYRQVMRSLTGGLRHRAGAALPSGPALGKGRRRLGSKPLELLFDLVRGPRAEPGTPGAFAFGLRVVSWDGTSLDAPRTGANIAAFGVPPGGWHPVLRLMALVECGTHAVIDAAFDSFTQVSEQLMARRLLHALRPGMLLLADRNFPGHQLWELAAATGAELIWRIPDNRVLTPLQVLADGSYLALLPTPAEAQKGTRNRRRGIPPRDGRLVRVIDAAVTARTAGGTATSTALRLITTLLDPGRAPAAQAAALYHERWESENGYSELKTRLKGTGFTLRSLSPDLVCQEMYALLAVYHALCALQADAAAQAGIDPGKISFTITIRTVRDQAKSNDIITLPGVLDQARRWAIADILGGLLPPRRDRRCQRVRHPHKNNKYQLRDRTQPRPPARVTYTITIDTSRTLGHPAEPP